MHLVHDPRAAAADPIDFADFLKVDIRAGVIVEAAPFPEARNPSFRLVVDFGAGIGLKKSVAQITRRHPVETLPGRRVLGVVNFPARQIGPARSEVLLLGLADEEGAIILVEPDPRAPLGARLA